MHCSIMWKKSKGHHYPRPSKSNPIELNFNRNQSNEIELTEKKKNHSNSNERSIFELLICVKQALNIGSSS